MDQEHYMSIDFRMNPKNLAPEFPMVFFTEEEVLVRTQTAYNLSGAEARPTHYKTALPWFLLEMRNRGWKHHYSIRAGDGDQWSACIAFSMAEIVIDPGELFDQPRKESHQVEAPQKNWQNKKYVTTDELVGVDAWSSSPDDRLMKSLDQSDQFRQMEAESVVHPYTHRQTRATSITEAVLKEHVPEQPDESKDIELKCSDIPDPDQFRRAFWYLHYHLVKPVYAANPYLQEMMHSPPPLIPGDGELQRVFFNQGKQFSAPVDVPYAVTTSQSDTWSVFVARIGISDSANHRYQLDTDRYMQALKSLLKRFNGVLPVEFMTRLADWKSRPMERHFTINTECLCGYLSEFELIEMRDDVTYVIAKFTATPKFRDLMAAHFAQDHTWHFGARVLHSDRRIDRFIGIDFRSLWNDPCEKDTLYPE